MSLCPATASYRSEIEYTPADQGFYRLRQARIVVAGDGPVADAVLRAGVQALSDYVVPGEFRSAVTDSADLVVQVTSDIGELIGMARRCRDENVSLTQVFVRGEDVWLTPVHTAGGRAAEAGWRRLVPSTGPITPIIGATAAVIGAQVALTCFRYLAGMSAAPEPVLLRLDRASLEITEHRYQWGGEVAQAPSADPIEPAELLDRLPAFVDPYVGLLSAVEQAGVVSWATVEDPRRRWPAHRVLGWAADPQTAKVRAVLAGMASYAALAAGRGWGWGTDLITGERRRVWLDQTGPVAAVGVAAGLSWHDAVAAGLQAHAEVRRDPMAPVRRWADETTPSDVDDFAKSLAVDTGCTPVAVPLDADPAAARLLPFTARILLLP